MDDQPDRETDLAQRLDAMLGEWLAEHGGGFVQGFHAYVELVDQDGDLAWATAYDDAAARSPSTMLGRLRFHTMTAERAVDGYLDHVDDDAD